MNIVFIASNTREKRSGPASHGSTPRSNMMLATASLARGSLPAIGTVARVPSSSGFMNSTMFGRLIRTTRIFACLACMCSACVLSETSSR
ncbi:hypothetical protein D3C83_45490 [compost metagenome]